MKTGQPTVLVFVKAPEPGQVKTRLAAAIGPERAAVLYRGWIGLVLRQLQPLRDRVRIIGYFAGGPASAFRPWHDLADDWRPQPAGDLGERLEVGFRSAHADGGPVIAVGTDCLEIDADLLTTAFAELDRHDAVFGPAVDGGYYLVGTARYLPGFFTGVRWSSRHTLADHQARCQEQGWSVGLLAPRHDIDTWDDWLAYRRRQGFADDAISGI